MFFELDITIPASTTEIAPKEVTFQIARGVISKFIINIPSGHAALAHLVILHRGSPIAPSIGSSDIHGDTFPKEWEDYYEVYQPPYELKLRGWNDDDTFPHTFGVNIIILPRKAIIALAIVDALKGLLTNLSPKRIFTRSA